MNDIAFHFVDVIRKPGEPMFWSRRPYQAYSRGTSTVMAVCRIDEAEGEHGERGSLPDVVGVFDLKDVFLRFCCDQALSCAHFWPMPEAKREYLTAPDAIKLTKAIAEPSPSGGDSKDIRAVCAEDAAFEVIGQADTKLLYAVPNISAYEATWALAADQIMTEVEGDLMVRHKAERARHDLLFAKAMLDFERRLYAAVAAAGIETPGQPADALETFVDHWYVPRTYVRYAA